MKSVSRLLLVAVVLLGSGSIVAPACADHPTAEDVAALRAVVEANFAAQTEGDVKALMATISPRIAGPQRVEFEREVRDYVKLETGLQLRLLSLTVITFYNPFIKAAATGKTVPRQGGCSAVAEVVQLTVPKGISHAELAEYPKELSTAFRHDSAMLPSSEVVKYMLQLEYDFQARCWKVHKITSAVRPVSRWPTNVEAVLQGEPPELTSRTGPSVQHFKGR